MLLNKNDDIELHIDSVSLTGSGVGRYNGLAVFVPATAPGDIIEAHIIKVKKSYAVGKCTKIIKPSPDRTDNDCPAYPGCGGCSFRHMSYNAELKLKSDAVRDAFSRIGGLDVELKPIIGAESPDGYRNKAQYPVGCENGELKIGFYSRRSHRIVDCRACRLAPPEFEKILGTVADWIEKYNISVYNETSRSGAIRHIYLRKAFATGEIMLCLVSAQENLPHTDKLIESLKDEKAIKSVLININPDDTNAVLGEMCIPLLGDGCITDILCGVKVRISPLSFYQVNRAQAEKLYKKAAEYAVDKKIKLLLDLYCGAGTIGLSMADKAEELIGIETVAPAIEDAKKNAAANGIENARFICADAGEAAEKLLAEGKRPEVIVLDPPRKGCSEQTVRAAAGMAPDRIVYVSCDPATLARDCAAFKELGYEVEEATPVDLFPRTAHVETVCLLSKLNVKHHIEVEITMDELDLTAAESKATYDEIKAYVLEKFGFKVSQLYIAQIKRKCGIIERKNYNQSKKEDAKVPKCPPEKEAAIMDALKHFQMIRIEKQNRDASFRFKRCCFRAAPFALSV